MELSYSLTIALMGVLLSYPKEMTSMKVKFTNIECVEQDKQFVTVKRCILKALARDTVALYINLQLNQAPVENITANAAFFHKGNGYRPYMYNTTLDVCKFFKNSNVHLFWKIILGILQTNSNLNQSCPLGQDVVIDGVILKPDMFKLIPFPTNFYMIRIKVFAYDRLRIVLRTYFEIYE